MKKFTPQVFLSALGAGGISVSGFASLNYVTKHNKGLLTFSELHANSFPLYQKIFYAFFESYMALFAVIHFILLVFLLINFFRWKKTDNYQKTKSDPLVFSTLLIPYIVLFMSLNVFIGVIRYFIPLISDNLQLIMPYGFAAWLAIWLFLMKQEINMLSMMITKKYDFKKATFNWMLHPFSLGMATVTGTGIAALSTSQTLAGAAAFFSSISLTMSFFLLVINSTSIFRNYFSADNLPEQESLLSILNLIPILTVLGISLFRLGHYFERNFNAHLGPFFAIITTTFLAFETWYLFFGLNILRGYLSTNLRKKFHPGQWSLVCPFVAYAVMASFTYSSFIKSPFFILTITLLTGLFILLYTYLLFRQIKYWVAK